MNATNNPAFPPSLDRLELFNTPTLVITPRLRQQIDFLHEKVGSAEWSGELITSEKGSITNLSQWQIIAEDLFLVDIGDSTYTEYRVGEGSFKEADIIDLYDAYPGLMEGTHKAQHLHSHHTMGAFFSGTDWRNLGDRAGSANYCLMLIVNFDGSYVAKVAWKATRKIEGAQVLQFSNNLDALPAIQLEGRVTEEEEVLVIVDCKIEMEMVASEALSPSFTSRYEDVSRVAREEAEKRKAEMASRVVTLPRYSHQGYLFEEAKDDTKGKPLHKPARKLANVGWDQSVDTEELLDAYYEVLEAAYAYSDDPVLSEVSYMLQSAIDELEAKLHTLNKGGDYLW